MRSPDAPPATSASTNSSDACSSMTDSKLGGKSDTWNQSDYLDSMFGAAAAVGDGVDGVGVGDEEDDGSLSVRFKNDSNVFSLKNIIHMDVI